MKSENREVVRRKLDSAGAFDTELVNLTDEAISTGVVSRSTRHAAWRGLSRVQATETLIPLDTERSHVSPAEIFDASAYSGGQAMRRRSSNFSR